VSGYGRGAGTIGSVARSTARPMKKKQGWHDWGDGKVSTQNGFGKKKSFSISKIFYKIPNHFEFKSNSNYELLLLAK
jgi:hypothetical protein